MVIFYRYKLNIWWNANFSTKMWFDIDTSIVSSGSTPILTCETEVIGDGIGSNEKWTLPGRHTDDSCKAACTSNSTCRSLQSSNKFECYTKTVSASVSNITLDFDEWSKYCPMGKWPSWFHFQILNLVFPSKPDHLGLQVSAMAAHQHLSQSIWFMIQCIL